MVHSIKWFTRGLRLFLKHHQNKDANRLTHENNAHSSFNGGVQEYAANVSGNASFSALQMEECTKTETLPQEKCFNFGRSSFKRFCSPFQSCRMPVAFPLLYALCLREAIEIFQPSTDLGDRKTFVYSSAEILRPLNLLLGNTTDIISVFQLGSRLFFLASVNGVFCYVPGVTPPFLVRNEVVCFVFLAGLWVILFREDKRFPSEGDFCFFSDKENGTKDKKRTVFGDITCDVEISSLNSPWASEF